MNALTAGGHKITLFNRGKRDPEAKAGRRAVVRRPQRTDLKALKGRDWDVVIDNSGYTPNQVKLTDRVC